MFPLDKKKLTLAQQKVLEVALDLYGEDLVYDCVTKNKKIDLRLNCVFKVKNVSKQI